MSYANQVNFEPNPNWNGYYGSTMICTFGNCYGHGVPVNGQGFNGNTYVDIDSGIFYSNSNGVWAPAAAGTGAGLTYTQGAHLDPNGIVTGSVGDVYHSAPVAGGDGSTWWKTVGTGNTGWEA